MTRYYVSYQPRGGASNFTSFDSWTLRAIWILDHALAMRVLSTWEGHETEPTHAA